MKKGVFTSTHEGKDQEALTWDWKGKKDSDRRQKQERAFQGEGAALPEVQRCESTSGKGVTSSGLTGTMNGHDLGADRGDRSWRP